MLPPRGERVLLPDHLEPAGMHVRVHVMMTR
jgi:hypothetical protein